MFSIVMALRIFGLGRKLINATVTQSVKCCKNTHRNIYFSSVLHGMYTVYVCYNDRL